jgi:hypothetical protein
MAGALVGGGNLSTGVTVATGAPVDFTDGKDQVRRRSFADPNTDVTINAFGTYAQALPSLTQWTVSEGRSRDFKSPPAPLLRLADVTLVWFPWTAFLRIYRANLSGIRLLETNGYEVPVRWP